MVPIIARTGPNSSSLPDAEEPVAQLEGRVRDGGEREGAAGRSDESDEDDVCDEEVGVFTPGSGHAVGNVHLVTPLWFAVAYDTN